MVLPEDNLAKIELVNFIYDNFTFCHGQPINKYLMCLSAVLTYATNELQIIEVNPMSKVKCLEKPNGRTRFLSDSEIYLQWA